MMKQFIFILLMIILNLPKVLAETGDVQVSPNQAKLEINGAVCAYCAYGMQKGLSKMDGIDRTKGHKGVETDIENQIIIIHLKPEANVNPIQMSEAINQSGYEPRTFHLLASGSIVREGNKTFLVNSNNEKKFELVGDALDQLATQMPYNLQLKIDENEIKSLTADNPPRAQISNILGKE